MVLVQFFLIIPSTATCTKLRKFLVLVDIYIGFARVLEWNTYHVITYWEIKKYLCWRISVIFWLAFVDVEIPGIPLLPSPCILSFGSLIWILFGSVYILTSGIYSRNNKLKLLKFNAKLQFYLFVSSFSNSSLLVNFPNNLTEYIKSRIKYIWGELRKWSPGRL